MHIPATVIVGDTLSGEMREHWYTPAHVLCGWDFRLRTQQAVDAAVALGREPTPEQAHERRVDAPPTTVERNGAQAQMSFDFSNAATDHEQPLWRRGIGDRSDDRGIGCRAG